MLPSVSKRRNFKILKIEAWKIPKVIGETLIENAGFTHF
jgi:hypothetical protein